MRSAVHLAVALGLSVTVLSSGPAQGQQAPAAAALPAVTEVVERAQPSVVSIAGATGALGSGFIVRADGVIATNKHVVTDVGALTVVLASGEKLPARVPLVHPQQDLALLQVAAPAPLRALPLRDSEPRVGEWVVALGNPFGLGPTATIGIIGATGRSLGRTGDAAQLVQTDAAINPGNSGGPLVNAAGEVVGINTAIIDGAQSVGFSIAIDQVRKIIEELEAGGGDVDPDQAVLGVETVTVDTDLDASLREQFGVTANQGALVTAVEADSAASDAGLLEGDVIVEADGEPVVTNDDITNIVRSHQKGDSLSIVVERSGRRRSFDVTLGPR